MKLISIVGARPNFMKLAPLVRELKTYKEINHLVVHTGQHFDKNMSSVFFKEFEIDEPDYFLGISGGSHAEQTAKIMIEFEKVLLKETPDRVLVVGDVNSTMACTLVASKLHIPVDHIEAGLRSFDRSMPEEINRVVTDALAENLYVTEQSGVANLIREGKSEAHIHFVGNLMIDNLVHQLERLDSKEIATTIELPESPYILVTLHRPSNVDTLDRLSGYLELLSHFSKQRTIIFPVHPRTKNEMTKYSLEKSLPSNIKLLPPLGYFEFLTAMKSASLILTDSGGIQEESTWLRVPCVTMRDNTERPVTVTMGTNHLVGTNHNQIKTHVEKMLSGEITKIGQIPPLWDGRAASRILKQLLSN